MSFAKGNKFGRKFKQVGQVMWQRVLANTVRAKDGGAKGGLLRILLAELKQELLPEPQLEVRFHPIRKWRFDLGWPDRKVAIEIHGAVYVGGRHTTGKGFENDREKMNEAQILGWKVLEYSTGQVKQGIPIIDLKRLLS